MVALYGRTCGLLQLICRPGSNGRWTIRRRRGCQDISRCIVRVRARSLSSGCNCTFRMCDMGQPLPLQILLFLCYSSLVFWPDLADISFCVDIPDALMFDFGQVGDCAIVVHSRHSAHSLRPAKPKSTTVRTHFHYDQRGWPSSLE